VPTIITKLNKAPGGSTPTADALTGALTYFTTGAGKDLAGDKIVLLATDGGPNCNANITCTPDKCTVNMDGLCPAMVTNCCDGAAVQDGCLDDVRTLAQVNALKGAGVSTVVLGIPGSETYASVLNSLALAGGLPNPETPPDYYAVSAGGDAGSGESALADVIGKITTSLIQTCEFELDQSTTPPAVGELTVRVDGEIKAHGTDWVADNDDAPTKITFVGALCDQILATGVTSVTVKYGCPEGPF
jgi:hypothetical protein